MCVEMWDTRDLERLRRISRYRSKPWYVRFLLRLAGEAPV